MDFSGIRNVFELAATIENPLNLSIGQPDFAVEESLKTVASQAIFADQNAYAPTAGLPEMRQALRKYISARYAYQPDDFIVTSGVSGGLSLAMLALLQDGDEILLPDPGFVSYKQLAILSGSKPVFYDLYPDWRINIEVLEALVTSRTRVLLVNSPGNPTGAVLSRQEMTDLADFAARHNLVLISDEIYDDFLYEKGELPSFGSLYQKTLVLNGFSKSQAMTGWRLGWATGPAELINAMAKIQQFTFVCAPPPFQKAAVKALESGTLRAGGHLAEYAAKRDLLCELLKDNFEFNLPAGAFYLFPRVPWGSGSQFAEQAIRNRVLCIGGGVFSERDTHFRLSFAAPEAVIREGAVILCQLARRGPDSSK
jgi:aspartate/methionine/tyrosine aminotransferase